MNGTVVVDVVRPHDRLFFYQSATSMLSLCSLPQLYTYLQFDGLVQERRNSNGLATVNMNDILFLAGSAIFASLAKL